MAKQLISVLLFATLYLDVSVEGYTDLIHTCFGNGTILVINPDGALYTNMLAVQNEGSSSAVICATASNGVEHTITNCSLDSVIVVYFSNRSAGYRHVIGSADIKDVVYEINCEDLPDAGVNRTVQNSLDITLEASTQDSVTPSFVITSAIRSGSALGSSVTVANVGETLYWTYDIPANYTSKATCDAYSGVSTSGSPQKRLTTGGCSDDDDLLGGDFNTTQSINTGLDTRYSVVLYAFKFYNSDDLLLHCVVTLCPSGSSSCTITGCSKKKRSVNEEALGPDDHRFTTGSLLHIMRENSAASVTGKVWLLITAVTTFLRV